LLEELENCLLLVAAAAEVALVEKLPLACRATAAAPSVGPQHSSSRFMQELLLLLSS
jgi:hypothetical protein